MKKLKRNKERDQEVNAYYHEKDWKILMFFGHEIKQNLDGVVDKIAETINDTKTNFHSSNCQYKKAIHQRE